MPLHDCECSYCHEIIINHFLSPWPDNALCPYCGGRLEILWGSSSAHTPPLVHPSERAVVWMHPQTGEVRWPGRNDIPMPQRYQDWGYERHEFSTRHELEEFEKSHKVLNEKLWYNTSTAPD